MDGFYSKVSMYIPFFIAHLSFCCVFGSSKKSLASGTSDWPFSIQDILFSKKQLLVQHVSFPLLTMQVQVCICMYMYMYIYIYICMIEVSQHLSIHSSHKLNLAWTDAWQHVHDETKISFELFTQKKNSSRDSSQLSCVVVCY